MKKQKYELERLRDTIKVASLQARAAGEGVIQMNLESLVTVVDVILKRMEVSDVFSASR